MAINIQMKTDYSYLFSGLSSNKSGSSANLNFLSDYAAIKNGSYAKLMKAYYNPKGANEAVSSLASKADGNTATEEAKKKLSKVENAADALKDSADALLKTGKDSLFNKKEITAKDENGVEAVSEEYDTDAIYKAVNSFVSNYNDVISAVDKSENERVVNKAVSMANETLSNAKLLNKIGITIEDDSTLSIDKDAFAKADMNTVKTLFNGTGSYGYRVSSQASMINFTAANESTKAGLYNTYGAVNDTYSSGSLFDIIM